MLGGHKGLDERVCWLSVEGQSVTQRGQLRTFLQECLLQPVASCMEVLLHRKQISTETSHKNNQSISLNQTKLVVNLP